MEPKFRIGDMVRCVALEPQVFCKVVEIKPKTIPITYKIQMYKEKLSHMSGPILVDFGSLTAPEYELSLLG